MMNVSKLSKFHLLWQTLNPEKLNILIEFDTIEMGKECAILSNYRSFHDAFIFKLKQINFFLLRTLNLLNAFIHLIII